MFGIGKGFALKQLRVSENFNVQAEVFNNKLATNEEIFIAGEAALVSLYNGSTSEITQGEAECYFNCFMSAIDP